MPKAFLWLRDCSQTNDCHPLATPTPCAHLLPFPFCQLWHGWMSYYIQGEKGEETTLPSFLVWAPFASGAESEMLPANSAESEPQRKKWEGSRQGPASVSQMCTRQTLFSPQDTGAPLQVTLKPESSHVHVHKHTLWNENPEYKQPMNYSMF